MEIQFQVIGFLYIYFQVSIIGTQLGAKKKLLESYDSVRYTGDRILWHYSLFEIIFVGWSKPDF